MRGTGTIGSAIVIAALVSTSCAKPGPPERPADEARPPAVAVFRCAADGSTEIVTPTVAAQPDGVHLHARLARGADLSFFVRPIGGGWGRSERQRILPIAPGTMEVTCSRSDDLAFDPGDDSVWRPIEVVDPGGVYVAQELPCSALGVAGEYPVPLEGQDPIEAARGLVHGLRPTDLLQRVGYVARPNDAHVGVRRDGELVAVVDLRMTREGWGWKSFVACEGSGLSHVP